MDTGSVIDVLCEMKVHLDTLPLDDEPVSAETRARIEAALAGERGISTEAMRVELVSVLTT